MTELISFGAKFYTKLPKIVFKFKDNEKNEKFYSIFMTLFFLYRNCLFFPKMKDKHVILNIRAPFPCPGKVAYNLKANQDHFIISFPLF